MKNKRNESGYVKYHPLAAFVLLSLTGVTQVEANNMTSTVVNGVTVIDINKANDHGISHNVYDKFNVDKNGLIFNNSQNAIKTTLAGEIQGNSNLTSGAAKVILNEVTSKNQSALQGWLEVAGSKAHLIIANPNGISCQGCGFINAEKVTVTTGKPDMQDGMLKGYNVNGGIVTLTQLENASPTEILARSIIVNGAVQAGELSLVAGNNYIDIDGKITDTVKAQGNRPAYGIDVAAIGGMYANKISLITSEKGVGVRNRGMIAGTESIEIDSSGKLVNNHAQIKSAGLINIKTNGDLDNSTGKISSGTSIYVDTNEAAINNSLAGNIAAIENVYIGSGSFNNNNGKISAGGILGLNTHNKTLTNTGKGNSVGIHATVVALQTGMLDNRNGVIKGNFFGAETNGINNSQGTIEATGDMEISSSANLENSQGLIRSTVGHVYIDAAKSRINNGNTRTADTYSGDTQGIIAGEGGIQIKAASLNNRTGQIASKGDISFTTTGGVDNYQGKLIGARNLSVKAGSLMNGQAGISSTGNIHIELADALTNSIGIINSDEGDIELQAGRVNNKGGLLVGQNVNIDVKTTVDNSVALIVANKNLVINTPGLVDNSNGRNFGHDYGIYLAMPNQQGGMIGRESVTINAGEVNNENSRIVAEFGKLAITAKNAINNSYGRIIAHSGLSQLKAQAIYNDYAMLSTGESMTIDTDVLSNYSSGNVIDNNATGILSAGKDLVLNIGRTFTNYGWINSNENTSVTVAGIFSNRNTVSAARDLTITAKNMIYNYKDMAAGNQLILKTDSDVKNSRGSNIQGISKVHIEAKGDVTNEGNIVSNVQLTVNAVSNIYNYSNMFSHGTAVIKAKNTSNRGSTALLGGVSGLEMATDTLSNNGFIIGL
ncbi:filamentous hemagglutinin [Mixta theicola]|uniref:Filamentous hemagglutinin n=1 Tax=Mixta theicola TaxID=1458355 RepID=A0A2K1QEK0_9GAMM|nr:filamentous hemagglutinin N-terminal domain-containing protein [Mixta theicola]PNS13439.1 filamentous hemagglutinin [Mixta theicola]GLR09755.1 hypothetical protein GCM10007905_24750 [Mixta theicola]